jgi:hypothetical protein
MEAEGVQIQSVLWMFLKAIANAAAFAAVGTPIAFAISWNACHWGLFRVQFLHRLSLFDSPGVKALVSWISEVCGE